MGPLRATGLWKDGDAYMTKPRAFVSRKIFQEALESVQAVAEAEIWPDDLPPPRSTLLEKVRGVDGLLCLLTDKVDGELMDAAGPQLKVISQIAVGYDNIEVRWFRYHCRIGCPRDQTVAAR